MRSSRIRQWAWLWIPLALFMTLTGWAITSPPGSSPDDDFHLSSIWCAPGEREGTCETSPMAPEQRLVPRAVIDASACYRFLPRSTGDCAAEVITDMSLKPTDRVNDVAGIYPTGYYRAMSILAGDDVERSVLLMRLANAALISILLALLLRVTPKGIAFATTTAMVATFVPLGLFISASTNPSSWAVAGILLFWGFALALLQRHDWRSRRTWLIAAGALISAAMAWSARVDSRAYLAVVVVIVLVLAGSGVIRRNRLSAALIALTGLAGALGYLAFSTPGGGEDGQATMGTADQGIGLLLSNLVQLPTLIQGAVGGWALGWNDTPLPPLVPFIGVLVLGGLAWAGLSRMWRAKALATAIAAVALIAVPLWFLQKEALAVGEVVQPRYLLPLLAVLMATLLIDRPVGRPIELPRTPLIVAAVGLAVTATLAFWVNAHRYAAGEEVGLFDLDVISRGSAIGGLPLSVLTLMVAASSVALVSGLIVLASRPRAHGRTLTT